MAHAAPSAPARPSSLGQIIAIVAALLAIGVFFATRGIAQDGYLIVVVQPAGAKVRLIEPLVEGIALEQVASTGAVRFDNLPRGVEAKVLASAKGYKQATASKRLPEAGGESRVELKLEREAAMVTVRTEPTEAMVFLDNRAAGMSPYVLAAISPGHHIISARKTGFSSASVEIDVTAGEEREVLLTLVEIASPEPTPVPTTAEEEAPIPDGFGRVKLVSSHLSSFFIDNQVAGMGEIVVRNVAAGPHLVNCRAEGRGSDSKRIEVVEKETTVVRFEFLEDPVDKARRALDPNDPLHWVTKGGGTRNQGRYGEAVEQFEHALMLDPDYVEAHRQLGFTMPPLGRFEEAAEHLEKYLELNPDAPDAEFAKEMIEVYHQKMEEGR